MTDHSALDALQATHEALAELVRLRAENERLREVTPEMVDRGSHAIYEMTRGASIPGVLNNRSVSHVGTGPLAEAVLRAALDEKCPNCHGTGEDPVPRQIGRTCPRCDGSGASPSSRLSEEER